MGWKPISNCKKVQNAYIEEKDIVFYKDSPDFFVSVAPDFFVIFFP